MGDLLNGLRTNRRLQGFFLGALAASLAIAVVGIAVGATSDNKIYGCRAKKGGALRIVSRSSTCKSGEAKISWNKEGPRGPRGPRGLQGDPGLLSSFDDVAGLSCTRGPLTGTIELTVDPSSGQAALTCEVSQLCGDGLATGDEQCDDGNTASGDGCSDVCTVEEPTAVCGNGAVEDGEQCDDGNNLDGDGCSTVCTIEEPAVCGNGVIEDGEQCDDGNIVGGDGCSAVCTDE